MISGYNDPNGAPVRNLHHIYAKSISMTGFIMGRIQDKYQPEFDETVSRLVAECKLKHREHIFEGLERVGDAILACLSGSAKGKVVVKVASE